MDSKQQIIDMYNRADEKGKTLLCGMIIIMTEGTEEERNQLNELAYGKCDKKRLEQFYNKCCRIVQEHIKQEA